MNEVKSATIPPAQVKVGQIFEAKKPKKNLYGEFNDRQILYVSEFRSHISYINHGFTQEFIDWCNKSSFSSTTSEYDQLTYESETGKDCKIIETVFDYVVQYDSPTVKDGGKYPSISQAEFLKWAGKEVTDIVPEGEWRR